jgi:ABC-type glutathione transport system ATPase component
VGDGLSVVLVSHDVVRAERIADSVRVLHDGRVTARGAVAEIDLVHEMTSPPYDGHEHPSGDPRAHGPAHAQHLHEPPDTTWEHG